MKHTIYGQFFTRLEEQTGYKFQRRPFHRMLRQARAVPAPDCPLCRESTAHSHPGDHWMHRAFIQMLAIGQAMDDAIDLIKATTQELDESRKVVEQLANEVIAIGDLIRPLLGSQITDIRQSRMTVVSEVQAALAAMRDVRKFFLESDYQVEIERLERFVHLCREIQALKKEGVLDAVTNTAIRLAIMEPEK